MKKTILLLTILFNCMSCAAEKSKIINEPKSVTKSGSKKGSKEKAEMNSGFEIGGLAPDFTLNNENGIAETLSKYRGKYVLIYFYPKDDTPGCTAEACSIRDNINNFKQLDVKVFGISADDEASHKKFIAKYNLPFSLLADTKKEVAKLYGADGIFIKRISFLIDKEGKFAKLYPNVNPSQHAAEILADLAELNN